MSLCICASPTHIKNSLFFFFFSSSLFGLFSLSEPELCHCLSTSSLLICIEPLSEISTTVTFGVSTGCQSAGPDGSQPEREKKGGTDPINKVNIISPRQKAAFVYVQKLNALNQLT